MFDSNHFIAVFAKSTNSVFGVDNTLPWNSPRDLAWFKSLTVNNAIIMGRSTFESFPKGALPNRINLVVTSGDGAAIIAKGGIPVKSLKEAAEYVKAQKRNCIQYVIGGPKLLEQAFPYCLQVIVSEINTLIPIVGHNSIVMAPKIPDSFRLARFFKLEGTQEDELTVTVNRFLHTGNPKSILKDC